jgi:hypothetical protein
MFKGKIFDSFLKVSHYSFSALALCAIAVAIYEKAAGQAESIVLMPALNFMFFSFFAKYNYAIQYWINQLERINNEERSRQLGQKE